MGSGGEKMDFHRRCAQLRKQTVHIEYSIYSEFTRIKFNQLCRSYDAAIHENNAAQIERNRAEIISFGCLSLIEEFEKAAKTVNSSEEYESISRQARTLVEEKWQKKLETISLLQLVRRITPHLGGKLS